MSDSPSLRQAKYRASLAIDEAAGLARARFITDRPGQELVYQLKAAQADQYLLAVAADTGAPVPSFIYAEATATGMSAVSAAQSIQAAATTWCNVVAPAIELARRAGKVAVAAAYDLAAVSAAVAAAVAALDAVGPAG